MGGEGSILAMIQSLKANKALLKRKKSFHYKNEFHSAELNEKNKLEFRKISEEELQILRKKYRKDRIKETLKSTIVFLILLGIVVLVLIYLNRNLNLI